MMTTNCAFLPPLSRSGVCDSTLFSLLFLILFSACSPQPCSENEFLRAAAQGDVQKVNACLSAGTDVDATDSLGNTALVLAAQNGHKATVQSLITFSPNTFITNDAEFHASQIAAKNGHFEIERAIKRFQYETWRKIPEGCDSEFIFTAITYDLRPILQDCTERGAFNPEMTGPHDMPPLIWAVFSGSKEVTSFLIEQGADVNDTFDTRDALMMAALFGEVEIAKLLLDAGAEINTYDGPHLTPLMLAAEEGYMEMVDFLLQNGAKTDMKDLNGETALEKAKKKGKNAIVKRLKKGA